MTTPLRKDGWFDIKPITPPTGQVFKIKTKKSPHYFTEEDLDVWPFYTSYLIELLNGEYSIEAAREDLLSLLIKHNRCKG